MLNVVCVHQPSKVFTPLYVNNLYRMVERHLTVPHRFHVLTTYDEGYEPGIIVTLQMNRWGPHWMQLETYRPGAFDGPVLYFDQDIFILSNIDFLAEPYDGPLMGLDDFFYPGTFNSGLTRFTENPVTRDLYENYQDPAVQKAVKWLPFKDQAYTDKRLAEQGIKPDFVQTRHPGKIISYKADYLPMRRTNGAAIVCCHGQPKPHEIKDSNLRKHWDGAPAV
jgi:hypothetical protein